MELGMGRSLEYQYKLEGVQREWQALDNERSIHFASLAPGSYRVLVRAINTDGIPTDPPASVDLFVATPVWQRWWSLTLMAIALALGIYGGHRRRMRQALELERVRMRIATDLHDDVGASLSQVAIMSEVVSRGEAPDRKMLAEIAGASREVLQSMSEIVWAIDPSHDRLNDLARRMRWFAGETLSGCGVALHFSLEERAPEIRLGIDARRQVFLIFKECVNNLARHARACNGYIAMKVGPDELLLEVQDDGCGFDAAEGAGHGLRNMAVRARALNAAFEVESHPGKGSRICLRIPLKQRRRRLWGSDTA